MPQSSPTRGARIKHADFAQGMADTRITVENLAARGEDVPTFLKRLAAEIEGRTLDAYRMGVRAALTQLLPGGVR